MHNQQKFKQMLLNIDSKPKSPKPIYSISRIQRTSLSKQGRSSFMQPRTSIVLFRQIQAAITDERYSPVRFYFDEAQKRQLKYRIDKRTKFKQDALNFIANYKTKQKSSNETINSERYNKNSDYVRAQFIQNKNNTLFTSTQRRTFMKQQFANHSCECVECGKRSKFQSLTWKEKPLILTKYQKHKIIYWRLKKIINGVIFLLRYKHVHNQRLRAKRRLLMKSLKKNREIGNQPQILEVQNNILQLHQSTKFLEINPTPVRRHKSIFLDEESSDNSSLYQLETDFIQAVTQLKVQIQFTPVNIIQEKPKLYFRQSNLSLYKYVDNKNNSTTYQSRSYQLKPLAQSVKEMNKQYKNKKSGMKSVVTSIHNSIDIINKVGLKPSQSESIVSKSRDTSYSKRNFRILLMDMKKKK